jgi:hypothetical protein
MIENGISDKNSIEISHLMKEKSYNKKYEIKKKIKFYFQFPKTRLILFT